MRFPSAIQPASSGTVVGVAIAARLMRRAFPVLVLVFAQGILDFCAHQLHKICTLGSLLIRLRPTCAPMTLDWGVVFVKLMTVEGIVAFEWPSMLLA